MSEPFIGEIRMFGGNFAPRAWALCNGQLLSIAQNTALFSLLGVNYGGDGRTTFGLPNLQASAPMFWGQGPGLTNRSIGEVGGTATVTLINSQMPMHNHTAYGSSSGGSLDNPIGNNFASAPRGSGGALYATQAPPTASMGQSPVGLTGGNQPHNNLQPYLAVTFIIALQGIFPQRP